MKQLKKSEYFSDRHESSNPFIAFIFRMLQVREDELMKRSVVDLVPEQPNKKKCCK